MLAFLTSLPLIGKVATWAVEKVGGFWLKNKAMNLEAANSHEAKVEAIVRRELDVDQREAEINGRQNEIDAGGGFYQSGPRATIGWIIAILLAKVFVWDLALHQWTGGWTPNPQEKIWDIIMLVIVCYFGTRVVDKIGTVAARALGGKK
jgi:hypothetical protein